MTSRRRISDFIGLTGPSRTGKGRAGATLLALVCLPVLASSVWSQSTSFRIEDIRAALDESNRAAESGLSNDPVAALANFTATLPAGHPPVRGAGEVHDSGYQPLLDYVEQLESGRPKLIAAQPQGHSAARDDVYSNLMEFTREIDPRTPSIQL